MIYTSIRPGEVWLDTSGNRIQAHGGSIFHEDGVYYWYGENKERTKPDNSIWHWGIRCYSSTDLYNWDDLGLIVPPQPDDESSPLHPAQMVDRPHIIRSRETGTYVCWIKVMYPDGSQRSVVLTADRFVGPYTVVHSALRPLGMSAGDFDLVVDPHDGKAYYYFERVHSELICADLTDDCTNVTGYYSTHFPYGVPPYVREAPAHFVRHGLHYLITSGTTGYLPNPSMVASAPSYHGPWTVLGDPHVGDASLSSFNSQVTSVFEVPGKQDLYIALADRWLPGLPAAAGESFANGDLVRRIASASAQRTDPHGRFGTAQEFTKEVPIGPEVAQMVQMRCDTSIADYVWLPIRFEGDVAHLDWRDEWSLDEFE